MFEEEESITMENLNSRINPEKGQEGLNRIGMGLGWVGVNSDAAVCQFQVTFLGKLSCRSTSLPSFYHKLNACFITYHG